MRYLNSINGFRWISIGNNDQSLAKTNICGEVFWIRECEKQENGFWKGIVDNTLLFTDQHGLNLNDEVIFIIS
jgi:hypothetical protein